jgi:hypothetical protein
VSWRYSADHAALRGRRREVDEPWLTRTLLKLSESCQKNWDDEQKKKITERRSGDTKTFLSVFFFLEVNSKAFVSLNMSHKQFTCSHYTQQHCMFSLKNWRDSNHDLLFLGGCGDLCATSPGAGS